MKKILIIFTGGTIGMKIDEVSGGNIPGLSGQDILKMTPVINTIAKIEYNDFGMIPGPHMTPEKMMELSSLIKHKIRIEKFDGVVVTHGTDTLEETAFLVDLTYNLSVPIVFVGSLKSSSEAGWDGPSNLIDGVFTAQSDEARRRGVLVVMNGEIHSASQVTKTHTHTLNTFKSSNIGPIGFIDDNKVYFYQKFSRRQYIKTNKIQTNISLIKCGSGMDSSLLNYCVNSGVKGIVVEAMGRGNVPPTMLEGIKNAVSKNIPVVVVSRCHMGKVLDSYGYAGAGKDLRNIGVIFGDNLPGQKARIKLMLAVKISDNIEVIREIFEKGFY